MLSRARVAAIAVLFGGCLITTAAALWMQLTTVKAEVDDAWGFAGMEGMLAVAFGAVGYLILQRTSNPAGWIFSIMGFGSAIQYITEEYAAAALASSSRLPGGVYVAWVAEWVWVPLIAGAGALLLVFPDDRIETAGARAVAAVGSVFAVLVFLAAAFLPPVIGTFGSPNPFSINGDPRLYDTVFATVGTGMMLCVLAAAVTLVGRLRRATGVRRLQLAWFAYAGLFAAVALIFAALPWTMRVASNFAVGGLLLMALSTARAILRYRLYDIDLIINRTLVYATLSAVLGLVYLGSVVLLQPLLIPITADSDVAIAASTLAVAALFRPLRARVQTFIDRRFYRRRFDAEATIAAFSNRLRDQVDLDALGQDLMAIVRSTMQPAHASLWLRRTE